MTVQALVSREAIRPEEGMMKKLLLVVCGLLALPALSFAQTVDRCDDCVLGLWDNDSLTTNYGTVTPNMPKTIYLALKLGAAETGITGVEFSIYGMRNVEDGIFILSTDWVVAPGVMLGPGLQAPADSSQGSSATGGQTVAWAGCQTPAVGDNFINLARITFTTFAPVTNKVFTIMHKFPQSNTNYLFQPILVRCDFGTFTSIRLPSGCYVANWDGSTALPCEQKTAVVPLTWGAVKQLYGN
jgi:hypothetical protein